MLHDLCSRMTFLCMLLWLLVPCATYAGDAKPGGEPISDELRQQLALPLDAPLQFVTVATSKDEKYSEAEAKKNAPDIVSFEACHAGGQRVLFKITFSRSPVFENAVFVLYADLDCTPETGRQDAPEHRGVDLMVTVSGTQVGTSLWHPSFTKNDTYVPAAKRVGNVLYITLDAPLKVKDGKVQMDLQLLLQRQGGKGDSTPRKMVELPYFPDRKVPKVTSKGAPDLRPLSDFRYHDQFVKLEKLEDKGLTYEKVRPAKPIEFGRPKPPVPFAAASRKPGQAGAAKRVRVPVQLLEEAGVARKPAAISFGFPLPKGALFDLNKMRVLSPAGDEVPAQFTATSFWPDDSLKWVLIDFSAPLAAKQECAYTVEFGSEVKRADGRSPLKVVQQPALSIVTGPLKLDGNKIRFDANKDGQFDDNEEIIATAAGGVQLVDQHGSLFRSSDQMAIEEKGAQKVVVRAEGPYEGPRDETYMRYIAREVFRAGSPRIATVYTHINDFLKTEFTDIGSLVIPVAPAGGIKKATVYLAKDDGALVPHEGLPISLMQLDEQTSVLRVGSQEIRAGKAPGIIRCETEKGTITVALHEFWERWPKGLSADANELRIELLPKQPNADFGKGLPHYLFYPFVEGFYRFKWGMSFTTRITFDFSPETTPEELLAEANRPVVPVLPASWYAQTKALGPMAAPTGKQFAQWDKYVASGYDSFVRRRDQDREYGYFNYGDWYGERGRNWGNNEYDFAHGWFMQFARTGNRDYFRLALTHARHEADVDCVHAYPDPAVVGGNHPHSIAHTGIWSERPLHGTWSGRYDSMTSAANGHTWADGMMDAWFLTGDAPVMESALALGEHVAWSMSRTFNALGTHERSAGWSLKAIMAIYRGTYDPLYLEAAKRIAAVALREQKDDDGGAWPHLLPEDHAGGHAGARGNNLFLIGVLLGGLTEYHKETHDPAVQKSLLSGAEWIAKSWDENAEGWPYSATLTGEPLYKPSTGVNALIIEPIAYVGHLTGDERFIKIAETGLAAVARAGTGADGKSIAQKMHFTSGTLALLQEWYAAHRPDKGATILDGSGAGMAEYLAKALDAEEYSVREPEQKTFWVKMRGETSELVANRRPHGAMTKQAEFGAIKVLDATGAVLKDGKFSTDDKYEFRCALKGAPGAVFKVVISDDCRSVWNVKGDGLAVVAQMVPGFRIGGVGRGRYHFFVPEGTQQFSVKLLGVHGGTYAGVVLSPTNKVVAFHQGINEGQALIRGAAKVQVPHPDQHPERGAITVKPDPQDTGKGWSLVLTAGGDIGCELEGVPVYLSLKAEEWFDPGAIVR